MFIESIAAHPLLLVIRTPYVISSFTIADGLGQVLQSRPVAGVHCHDAMGPFCVTAVKVYTVPVDNVTSGPRLMPGAGITVIVTKAVSLKQLYPSKPMTRYFVVVAGEAIVFAVVVLLRFVAGVQT